MIVVSSGAISLWSNLVKDKHFYADTADPDNGEDFYGWAVFGDSTGKVYGYFNNRMDAMALVESLEGQSAKSLVKSRSKPSRRLAR